MQAVDPVCGMSVDTAQTPYKAIYKGKIYYFCSPQCKKAFQENPEYYLEHGPQGMPGEKGPSGQGHAHGGHGGHSHGHTGHSHGCGC